MRSLFAFVGGALITFLALGYYFNWYSFSKQPGSSPGHVGIAIDINTKKINDDASRGIKAGTDKLEQVIHKAPEAPTTK